MNAQVRASEGASGELVIVAAWCKQCRAEAIPDELGRCGWCGTRIVDEHDLRVADVLGRPPRVPDVREREDADDDEPTDDELDLAGVAGDVLAIVDDWLGAA